MSVSAGTTSRPTISAYQTQTADTDNDGIVDIIDTDDDGDGTPDGQDSTPQGGETTTNTASNIEMVTIPAGCYLMGALPSDSGAAGPEKPQHQVCLQSFKIGKYEVTQGQWRAVMGVDTAWFSSCGDNCPVEMVSWDDTQSFLAKLNQQTGQSFKLPSEAQWEYACRGGAVDDLYCGGNDPGALAWYSINSSSQTHPVGEKKANGYGLYDMSGNAFEWVTDCWYTSYHGAPDDGSAWLGDSCSFRVMRGGSWYYGSHPLRASFRGGYSSVSPYRFSGFRLLQD